MEISDSNCKRGPMCIECAASQACETGNVVNPRRCQRCKCVEATLARPNGGPDTIFLVARKCPRVTLAKTGLGTGFFCVECVVRLSVMPGLGGVK